MYGKTFESMYEGSMVGSGINVFAVWNYIITKGKFGFIEINPKLLSFTLGGTEAEILDALEFLQKPDPESRSKLEEGRRLVKEGQFQYRIVNWEYYDQIKNEIERRDYNRIRQQKHRAGKSHDPTKVKTSKPPTSTHISEEIYNAYPRKVGRPDALRAITKALITVMPDVLLEKTKQYAAARKGEPEQYTPHPATWYNGERYNDDPTTWKSNSNGTPVKPNPRNFGVIVGPTDYASATPRLQRELEEKRRLAKQVAAAQSDPSPA